MRKMFIFVIVSLYLNEKLNRSLKFLIIFKITFLFIVSNLSEPCPQDEENSLEASLINEFKTENNELPILLRRRSRRSPEVRNKRRQRKTWDDLTDDELYRYIQLKTYARLFF